MIISHCFQARALYDFDAEPGYGEVSIRVDDILTLTMSDVGMGWWEGWTPQGQIGFFPEAYVEVITVEETNTGPSEEQEMEMEENVKMAVKEEGEESNQGI